MYEPPESYCAGKKNPDSKGVFKSYLFMFFLVGARSLKVESLRQ